MHAAEPVRVLLVVLARPHDSSFIHRPHLPLQRLEFAYHQPVNGAGAMHKQLAELRLQQDGLKPLKLRSIVRRRQSQRRALGAQEMLQTVPYADTLAILLARPRRHAPSD